MIDLNSPLAAQMVRRIVDEQVQQRLLELMPTRAYGVVSAKDVPSKKVSVLLQGSALPSPGFRYEDTIEPNVGDRVRTVSLNGDRYIDAVYGSPHLNANEVRATNLIGTLEGFDRLRYVPIENQVYAPFSAATTTIAIESTAELTMLPSDGSVRLVTGVIVFEATAASTSTVFRLRNYGTASSGQSQGALVYAAVANQRFASGYVVTVGGTGNRSVRYTVSVASGTATYWLQVSGYFTDA